MATQDTTVPTPITRNWDGRQRGVGDTFTVAGKTYLWALNSKGRLAALPLDFEKAAESLKMLAEVLGMSVDRVRHLMADPAAMRELGRDGIR